MQVSADQRPASVGVGFERAERLRLCRDRVVDHVVRNDAEFVEDVLRAADVPHVRDTRGIAIVRLVPVEFFLGVNDDDEDGPGLRIDTDEFTLDHRSNATISE